MKLIGFADDNDSKLKMLPEWLTGWNTRVAARAVLLDEEGKIALMYIGKDRMYKLPGGGVDKGESLSDALFREILEETGCKAEQGEEIGVFLEKRDGWKLFQISFAYLAKATEKGKMSLTQEEKESGFSLFWVKDVNEAISLISQNFSSDEDYSFMSLRDLNILRSAKEILERE